MENRTVLVGIANEEGINQMKVEDIKDWEPTKIAYVGSSAYFKIDETFYSMNRMDFKELYAHKL
jgi:hypothetical protein